MSLSLPLADADLAQAAAALADWRSTRPARTRVPARFWSRAVELAATHGVAKVARTLRLDYTALKRRVTAASEPSAPEPAAFVEVSLGLPVPVPVPGCVLALSDGQGRTLRIEWHAATPAEVAAVACRLWQGAS
jgi:hypothetical protein